MKIKPILLKMASKIEIKINQPVYIKEYDKCFKTYVVDVANVNNIDKMPIIGTSISNFIYSEEDCLYYGDILSPMAKGYDFLDGIKIGFKGFINCFKYSG
jgi:hypothetical protein